jgi:queuine tRNA-ribosyltransferase subunit QTRTD1
MMHARTSRDTNLQTSLEKSSTRKMAEGAAIRNLDQLPPEMIEFTLLKTTGALAPRLGRIALAGRKTILTPAFIGNTSRGVIPHISQDNFRKSVDVNGVYVPLEDCMHHPAKSHLLS